MMRSPIGGFNAQDMIRIGRRQRSRHFYQAVAEYPKQDDDLAERLKEFYGKIIKWQTAARYQPMEEFIWRLYKETGYYYYVGAMPGDCRGRPTFACCLSMPRFQQTSIKGLFQFIRFIERLQSSNGDMGVAKTLGENENVLRIMSIHKSKGLEFPVVIVGGLGKRFNLTDINASVLFHKDLGLGARYVNPDTRQSCETIAKTAIKQVIRLESLSEEMRILYVALTRPKDRLILLGSADNLQYQAQKWAKPISPYSLSRGMNFLDWIGPVLMRHPDCNVLRNLLEEAFDQPLLHSESGWRVQLHAAARLKHTREDARAELCTVLQHPHDYIHSIIRKAEEKTQGDNGKPQGECGKVCNMIKERFPGNTPPVCDKYSLKLTVTEINKLYGLREAQLPAEREEFVPSFITGTSSRLARPGFLEGSRQFTAAEKGSIVHFILQHLELDRAGDEHEVVQQLNEMVQRELLTEEEVQAADLNMIMNFLNSQTGRRIRNAEGVRREVPFNLRKKACELFADMQSGSDTLLVQGVIDCF